MTEPQVGTTIVYPGLAELQEKIIQLDQALKQKHPAMESLLQTIHRNLDKDPELTHLLKEEDIAVIIMGLEEKTKTKIIDDTVKSAASGRNKSLKSIGMEDL